MKFADDISVGTAGEALLGISNGVASLKTVFSVLW